MRGFVRDITQRKTLEQALRETNESLEVRVKERTAELEQARSEAETANQSKSRFLSQISHELRTPMNAVLGFARLLQLDEQEPLSATQRESVEEIVTAGQHLLQLLNDLLDLARVDAGKLHVVQETVSVTRLLDDCLALVAPEIAARELSVRRFAANGPPPQVIADPQRLRQVMLNLLSNAIKYNRAGGLLTVATHGAANGFVRIEVGDNGLGLTAAQRARLFEPFERLSMRDDIPGTGLGLALARQLVEAMGGSIGVDSEPGRGSTFHVCLPVSSAAPRLPHAGDE